jgi:hypothetical protein
MLSWNLRRRTAPGGRAPRAPPPSTARAMAGPAPPLPRAGRRAPPPRTRSSRSRGAPRRRGRARPPASSLRTRPRMARAARTARTLTSWCSLLHQTSRTQDRKRSRPETGLGKQETSPPPRRRRGRWSFDARARTPQTALPCLWRRDRLGWSRRWRLRSQSFWRQTVLGISSPRRRRSRRISGLQIDCLHLRGAPQEPRVLVQNGPRWVDRDQRPERGLKTAPS